ncbi:MAG: YCF48-related protein [Rhodobacteraceae bacterium]|nr:YCF48-related protein [Paracoccaceae bacterium]
MAALPTSPAVYFFAAFLFGIVAVWRFRVHAVSMDPGVEAGGRLAGAEELLRVAYEQRRRARWLRTGAVFLLASAVVILGAGLYFTAVVVPFVDRLQEDVVARKRVFEERYGTYLDAAVEGLLWVVVPHGFVVSSGNWRFLKLAFSKDGAVGLAGVGSDPGKRQKILVTSDGGRSWKETVGLDFSIGPRPVEGQQLVSVFFHDDSRNVLAVGNNGLAFLSEDGGVSWSKAEVGPFSDSDWIVNTWRGSGDTVFSLSYKGKLASREWGSDWEIENLNYDQDNRNVGTFAEAAAFNADGSIGVLGLGRDPPNTEQRIFKRRRKSEGNSTSEWVDLDPVRELGFKQTEWLNAAAFTADGTHGVLAGANGTIRVTSDGGETWALPSGVDVEAGRGEGWLAVALSETDENGVLVSTKGSVFVSSDRGTSWNRRNSLQLLPNEELHDRSATSFSAEATHGVLVGKKGSVFVTTNGGGAWHRTQRFNSDYEIKSVASVAPSDAQDRASFTAVGLDEAGNLFKLEPHPQLANWRDRVPATVLEVMSGSPVLGNSPLYLDMENFVKNEPTVAIPGDGANGHQNWWNALLDPVLLLRLITITFLLFLVAMFVRLYQYNLRLAAFWESRSDVLILANGVSKTDTAAVGELAAALSPDAYDFKSSRSSFPENVNVSAKMAPEALP